MWKPKYIELKNKSIEIYREHTQNVSMGIGKMKSATKLGKKHHLSMWSVYRYIKYAQSILKKNEK